MEAHPQRKLYLDILRIAASFAVMLIHVSTLHYYDFDPRSMGWLAINVYDGISRWAVPVFVMISGALFLDPARPFSPRRHFLKNIVRIATAFLFWSFVYALPGSTSFEMFWEKLLSGHFHMWFLPMIIGLYVFVPVYRHLTASSRCVRYYLTVGIVLLFLLPDLLHLWPFSLLEPFAGQLCEHAEIGYSVYFIGGWYLSAAEFSKKQRMIIYLLGVFGLAYTLAGTSLISYCTGHPTPDPFFSYFSTGVMLESAALFVLARYGVSQIKFSSKAARLVTALSGLSFGAYLSHILFLDLVQQAGLTVASFPAVLSVPVITAVIFALSMLVSLLIRRIPVLHRYIM